MGLLSSAVSEHPDYDLGTAMAAAIRRYAGQVVRDVAAEAMAAAPNWAASLSHLEDYVRQQIGGLAGRVNVIDGRLHQLEILAAQAASGQAVHVQSGDSAGGA